MLPYTGNPLDRRSDKRPDTAWIEAQRARGVVLPLWRQQVLVSGEPLLTAVGLSWAEAALMAGGKAAWVFLGLDGETPYFALDVSAAADAPEVLKPLGHFEELRQASLRLRRRDLAILSQAKGMLEWHDRNGFCPRCGTATEARDGGTKRTCPLCGTEHFPRTDPAVIMLATNGEHCLLARNAGWSPDFYSCLAGFMEPGESVEEAVRRELYEEAGVRAGAVQYFASQPWPFPAALMLGCFAEVENRQLRLDHTEIADAVWYSREEARALLEGKIEGRRGPMKVAVAWHLIKGWVDTAPLS